LTSGDNNVVIGYQAGSALTASNSNVFVGYQAGLGAGSGCHLNTTMGYKAGEELSTGDNNLLLGASAGDPQSPGGQIDTENNQIVLGNHDISNAHIQVDWTVASDKRDKTDVEAVAIGLDFVNKLEPVTYRWDKRADYSGDLSVTPTGEHKADWLDIGFLAQDVVELEKQFGFDVDNKTNLTTDKSKYGTHYGIQYSKFVPILTKAVQELSAQVTTLQQELKTLKGG
jgi:hypothetical protein